jgi:hypothetical protein
MGYTGNAVCLVKMRKSYEFESEMENRKDPGETDIGLYWEVNIKTGLYMGTGIN